MSSGGLTRFELPLGALPGDRPRTYIPANITSGGIVTYPFLSKDAADKADDAVAATKKNLDALKKAKGDKKQIAKLEKQLAAESKPVVTIATRDIKVAAAGMKKLEAEVESLLGAASKRLIDARAALKAFEAKKDTKVLAGLADLGDDLQEMAERANKAMEAFAVSWNEYRQAKFSVDPKLLKDFSALRSGIIDRTIKVRGKQQKIVGIAAEGASLESRALEADQGFETDSENRLGQLVKLHNDVKNVIVQASKKNGPDLIERSVPQYQAWLDNPNFDEFKAGHPIRQGHYKSMTSVAQLNNQALSTLKRTVANGKKLLTAADLKDGKIQQVVKEIDATLGNYEALVKKNLKILPELAKMMTAGDKRLKAGK
jgi:hypothetical protein